MNRKTLALLIVSAAILIAGIAAAIYFLYSDTEKGKSKTSDTHFLENNKLIKAIPSDAAIVFCVKDFERAQAYIVDSSAVFSQLLSGKLDGLMKNDYPGLKKDPAILSVHYSKDMPPLLVLEADEAIADTTADLKRFLSAADSSGLFTKVIDSLILVSPSETIISSSARHIAEGHSVLESTGFSELAAGIRGEDVIFISNAYTENILGAYFAKKHQGKTDFIKELSSWTALTITKHTSSCLAVHGDFIYGNGDEYYLNVLGSTGSSAVKAAEAVPPQTDFFVSMPVEKISSYIKAHRSYLDAKTKLDKFLSTLSSQKSAHGENAEEWAKSLNIQEIAIAGIQMGDKLEQFLLIKPGAKAENPSGVKSFPYSGYAKSLFGELFTGSEETSYSIVKDWIVVGSAAGVKEYSKPGFLKVTLQDFMSKNGLGDRIPQKRCCFFLYHSMSEDPTLIDGTFSPSMAKACRKILKGATFVPMTLAAMAEGEKIGMEMSIDKTLAEKSISQNVDRDTTVAVPAGPFKVLDSKTGKTTTFYQNSHLAICLQDEKGKDLWGIPLKQKICGKVAGIDFFNNGKMQYLFAAGSKLYLIDRLGRFVSGFPVDIGKEIAVGPEAFDFKGVHSYSALVLLKDNTVGLYDLHGKKKADWKGITAKETIKSLPELLRSSGSNYWIVRTSAETLVFPFSGGEPVVKGEGDKRIRPDSKVEINAKGQISAMCYDGKNRTFKLGN